MIRKIPMRKQRIRKLSIQPHDFSSRFPIIDDIVGAMVRIVHQFHSVR
jgi:hypothetical protein